MLKSYLIKKSLLRKGMHVKPSFLLKNSSLVTPQLEDEQIFMLVLHQILLILKPYTLLTIKITDYFTKSPYF